MNGRHSRLKDGAGEEQQQLDVDGDSGRAPLLNKSGDPRALDEVHLDSHLDRRATRPDAMGADQVEAFGDHPWRAEELA